jgi:hypothetical protein
MVLYSRDMQAILRTAVGTAGKIVRSTIAARAKEGLREGRNPLRGAAERHAAHRVKSAIPLYGPLAAAGSANSFAHGYAAGFPAAAFPESLFPTHCKCSTFRPRQITGDAKHRVYKCDACAPKAMGLGDYVTMLEGARSTPPASPRRFSRKSRSPSSRSNRNSLRRNRSRRVRSA